MGKYKCSVCKDIFYCKSNTSGIGVCPKCTPEFMQELNNLPPKGDLKDLPAKFNPFKLIE